MNNRRSIVCLKYTFPDIIMPKYIIDLEHNTLIKITVGYNGSLYVVKKKL